MAKDPLTSTLPAPLAVEGHYNLRRVDGELVIYLDYTDEDSQEYAYRVRGGISHEEDFSTHVDDLEEEARILRAEARLEFGL